MVLSAGLFLSGCTKAEDENLDDDQLEDVVVVDDTDDDTTEDDDTDVDDTDEDVSDDTDDVEDDDADDADEDADDTEDDDEEDQDDDEDSDSSEDATELEDGSQSVGSAVAADGAAVTAYSYGIANGKLEFSWKIRGSSTKPYPKATAKLLSNKNIVVEFESLVGDYVATEADSMDLGNLLPELSWMPTSTGSKYTFEYDTAKSFELSAGEIEGDKYIILKVAL